MPSRKSKPTGTLSSRSSAAHICSEPELNYSEPELKELATKLAQEIQSGGRGRPRVVLRGALGAGKSTFARAMLEAFGVLRGAEGSPTFAIAHEYCSAEGWRVLHADGYRLGSEEELEATGLLEPLWDPEVVVLFEWLERFSETEAALKRSELSVVWIEIGFVEGDAARRSIRIVRSL